MSGNTRSHVLLFTEAQFDGALGSWRFALTQVGAADSFSASDVESITCPERLELLAVVRGLEAIDQPSRVTLLTDSRYVNRGLKHGLAEWRTADWQWERFGQLVPVRNRDLWRRVDRALQFHELDCRLWRFDAAHDDFAAAGAARTLAAAEPVWTAEPETDPESQTYPVRNRRRCAPSPWNNVRPAAGLAAG